MELVVVCSKHAERWNSTDLALSSERTAWIWLMILLEDNSGKKCSFGWALHKSGQQETRSEKGDFLRNQEERFCLFVRAHTHSPDNIGP
jgi:predicted secreted hydrolase